MFGGSGLVWYGGAIGGAIGVLIWAHFRGMVNLGLLDLCSAPLALGYAIGRIGCQVSGDGDYGIPWNGPWAMAYPDGTVPTKVKVHPTPIYETLAMCLLAWALWVLRDRYRPGVIFGLYLVGAGLERFLVEFIRRNDAVAARAHDAAARERRDVRSAAGSCCGCCRVAVAGRRGSRPPEKIRRAMGARHSSSSRRSSRSAAG